MNQIIHDLLSNPFTGIPIGSLFGCLVGVVITIAYYKWFGE